MSAKSVPTSRKRPLRQTHHRFRELVYQNYREHGRHLPWRETRDPYAILVSEIMLQQTQVERVLLKYPQFLASFPDFDSLACADVREVLRSWSGLGYNRRALALKRIAQLVRSEFGGTLPREEEILRTFPGIGAATAGALRAFVFSLPAVFIETNIRRVFIYFFFPHREKVRDREILPLVEETLDRARVRAWYYALMDYGVMLKGLRDNPNRRSAHYARQSPFRNSRRRIRGLILSSLVKVGARTVEEFARELGLSITELEVVAHQLAGEGFVELKGDLLTIAGEVSSHASE